MHHLMAHPRFISFLFLYAFVLTTGRARSEVLYTTGNIPSSIREALKPVLSRDGVCSGKNTKSTIYMDHTPFPAWFVHKGPDAAYHKEHRSSQSFLVEHDLFSGNPLKVLICSTGNLPECAYLPRAVADSIPFSSAHFDEILSKFSIDHNSSAATAVKGTLELCEWPAFEGEDKKCATSLEAMEEFAVEKLGRGTIAVGTEMEADSAVVRTYQVKRVELKGEKYMSCHRRSYPYAVHYCHSLLNTPVYKVLLLRDDGVYGEAMATCHRDTSKWGDEFFAFINRLNVKPGLGKICHFFPKGHILWLPADEKAYVEAVA